MSIKFMNLVWNSDVKGCPRRMVLLAIADNANDAGFAWPSFATLVYKTGLSPNAVKEHVRGAVKDGQISKVARYRDNGSQKSNMYRMNPDAFPQVIEPDDPDDLAALFEESQE